MRDERLTMEQQKRPCMQGVHLGRWPGQEARMQGFDLELGAGRGQDEYKRGAQEARL